MQRIFKKPTGQFPSQNAKHLRRSTIPLISQMKKTKALKSFKRCDQSHTAVIAEPKLAFGPLRLMQGLHPANPVIYFSTKFKRLTHPLQVRNVIGNPGSSGSKESTCNAMQETYETRVWCLGWEDLWRRKWQPTAVFLPGELPWTEPGGLRSSGSLKSQTQPSD